MRAWFLLVLLVPLAHADQDEALAWLAQRPVSGPDAVIALASAGVDPRGWPDGRGPLAALEVPADASAASKHLLAVALAAEGTTWEGRDLLAEARAAVDAVVASPGIGDDAYLLLALDVWGDASPQRARLAEALAAAQQEDGGWSCFGPSSTDCTGYAAAALGQELMDGPAARATAFLDAHVDADGGVRSDNSTVTTANANSAAWYLRSGLGTHRAQVHAWLLGQQEGGVAWSDTVDVFATLEALPVLDNPDRPWPRAVAPPPVTVRMTDSGAVLSVEGWNVTWTHAGTTTSGDELGVALGPGLHSIRVVGTDGQRVWRQSVEVAGPPQDFGHPPRLISYGAIAIGAALAGLSLYWKRR